MILVLLLALSSSFVKCEFDNLKCEYCKFTFVHLNTLLQNGLSPKEIKDVQQVICAEAKGLHSKVCKHITIRNTYMSLQLLKTGKNPLESCETIKYCPLTSKKENVMNFWLNSSVTRNVYADPNVCLVCKNVVRDITRDIVGPVNPSTVEHLLDKYVCSIIPESFRDACKSVAHTYAPQIADLMKSDLDPEGVCKMLTLCSSGMSNMQVDFVRTAIIKMLSATRQPKLSNPQCMGCRFVISEVKNFLENSQNYEAVAVFLSDRFCILTGQDNLQCKKNAKIQALILLGILINEIEPTSFCKSIHLCSKPKKVSTFAHYVPKMKKVETTPLCAACEAVVYGIERILVNNRSEAAIKEAIKYILSVLPKGMQEEAKAFVDKYGSELIKLIEHADSRAICQLLSVCFASPPKYVPMKKIVKPVVLKQGQTCNICKGLINFAKEYLDKESSKELVKDALERICHFLPQNDQKTCTMIIDSYEEQLIDALLKDLDAETVCKDIGMCTSKVEAGLNMCSYGLRFICKSKQLARRCGVSRKCNNGHYRLIKFY